MVLVFGFASAVVLLIYERRPKLLLSAPSFGYRALASRVGESDDYGGGGGGGGGGDRDEGMAGSSLWRGGGGSGIRRRGRPRGALTEMVMESELGMPEASYRLLDDEPNEDDEEGDGAGKGGGGVDRRAV